MSPPIADFGTPDLSQPDPVVIQPAAAPPPVAPNATADDSGVPSPSQGDPSATAPNPNVPEAPAEQPTSTGDGVYANRLRNFVKGAVAGAGVAGALYTAVAVANMEDGAGEAMLALRVAQMARFGESAMFMDTLLEQAASIGGMVDRTIAFLHGGALGAGAGGTIGLLVTPSKPPGH